MIALVLIFVVKPIENHMFFTKLGSRFGRLETKNLIKQLENQLLLGPEDGRIMSKVLKPL